MSLNVNKSAETNSTPERIIVAAEHLFGEHGFDGTSVRDISERAGVRLGLVTYHFANKEQLYERVIKRRAAEMGHQRLELLAHENMSAAPGPIPLDRIVYAYVWPFLEKSKDAGPEWESYTKLISNVVNSQRWSPLLSGNYDPVARVFIGEFCRSLPDQPRDSVVLAFTFMVSIMLGISAQTGRAEQLSDGKVPADDISRIFGTMLPFIHGGFKALPSE